MPSSTATTTRKPTVGVATELARYALPDGERRRLVGQRVDGIVRVTDRPAAGRGRSYLIERDIQLDGMAALDALVADYLAECERRGEPAIIIRVGDQPA